MGLYLDHPIPYPNFKASPCSSQPLLPLLTASPDSGVFLILLTVKSLSHIFLTIPYLQHHKFFSPDFLFKMQLLQKPPCSPCTNEHFLSFLFCAYSDCNAFKTCPDLIDLTKRWLFSILTLLTSLGRLPPTLLTLHGIVASTCLGSPLPLWRRCLHWAQDLYSFNPF